MRRIVTAVLVLALMATTGCIAGLRNAGEVGFKQSTSWGFYSRAEATEGNSEARLDLQPAIDYLIQLKAEQDESAEVVE